MPTRTWTPDEDLSRVEMWRLGHFHPEFGGHASWDDVIQLDPKAGEFRRATSRYQMTAELLEDEGFGPHTVTSLRFGKNAHGHERICNCPDILSTQEQDHLSDGESLLEELNISNGTRTWITPKEAITFALNFRTLPGLDEDEIRQAWNTGLGNWNNSCGVNLVLTNDYNNAMVPTWKERLSGSTLAIALLSNGSRKAHAHWQKYDIRQWMLDYLIGTIIHETGHTLGFSHENSGISIMRPFMDPNTTRLTPKDLKRVQRYYGQPFITEPPTPPDPDDPEPPLPPDDSDTAVTARINIGKDIVLIRGEGTIIRG